MKFGSIGAGRVGQAVMQRLKSFGVNLHYHDQRQIPKAAETELGATFWKGWKDMVGMCDVVALNCPLNTGTMGLINKQSLGLFKPGAILVSARSKLCDTAAVKEALETGELGGFACVDDNARLPELSWEDAEAHSAGAAASDGGRRSRSMPNSSITPDLWGNSVNAQARIAAGVREILECYIDGRPMRKEYMVIVPY
jgi:formate dehydrogenase